MSAKKTDTLKSCLIAITILLSLSSAAIIFVDSQVEELSTEQKIANKNQALTTTAIFFLGLAVMVNAYYAAKRAEAIQNSAIATEKNHEINIKNLQLAQEQLIAERLMTAITQLGHEDVATRTGAIYVLEQVAQDSPKEYWTIMEIISAFVREKAGIREELAKIPRTSTDIQAAMTVIGRRNVEQDRENQKLDLRNAVIRQVDLTNAKLQSLDLRGADLTRAQLRGADLFESNLENARLCGTILYEANLRSCNLQAANFSGANLNRANLAEANLRSANLSGASLRAANLSGANLYKANLQGANLKVANLSKAKLFLANLQGAKLGKAKLQLTGLIGANLKGANLNGADLQQANLNAAKLQQTEIFFANLDKASLREADLLGANLMGANLQQAIFHEANLCGTNLMGANLFGANLDDVKLQGAILKGAKNLQSQQIKFAIGDRTTILPDYLEAPVNWMRSQHSQTSAMESET
ncbi:pentapeptide repeat-containing protein [Chlorogloeopsis sp. ULAP01]|uniref:pentapeptide repeat-containing protein n=1 Tax=Chlorogloeopsis sp. ULAP01 TaxID=3056483 RepID=UPI0025AA6CD9|nr:pentapeptide repeat-containing protein [Chlorogloeopsis sp. ULAP01]MDM9380623.1 pentapeptide repeat-containing protein [Chlorogloeopsis sp. ULAP01]